MLLIQTYLAKKYINLYLNREVWFYRPIFNMNTEKNLTTASFRSLFIICIYFCILFIALVQPMCLSAQFIQQKSDAISATEVKPEDLLSKRNYEHFYSEKGIFITEQLLALTPAEYRQHPEFGKFVYKQVHEDYLELVHKRTENSRYFIHSKNPNKFYTQTAHGALHYRNENGYWISINPNLAPISTGYYAALNQPNPTAVHLPTGKTSIQLSNGYKFEYNANLSMCFRSKNGSYVYIPQNDISQSSTVGSEGTRTKNIFQQIDREASFGKGKIETDFIFKSRSAFDAINQINANHKFSAPEFIGFDEVISLPEEFFFRIPGMETIVGKNPIQGNSLELVDRQGNVLLTWERPTIYDINSSIRGFYEIELLDENERTYRLSYLVENEWMQASSRVFPIIFDPIVKAKGKNAKSMGFKNNKSCTFTNKDYCTEETPKGYKVDINLPAKSAITEVSFLLTAQYSNPPSKMKNMNFSFENECSRSPKDTKSFWGCATTGKGSCSTSQNGIDIPYQLENSGDCILPSCKDRAIPFYFQGLGCDCEGATTDCPRSCQWVEEGDWIVLMQGEYANSGTTSNAGTEKNFYVCLNENVTFYANPVAGVGPYKIKWTGPDGLESTDSSISDIMDDIGVYKYTLEISDGCGGEPTREVYTVAVVEADSISFSQKNLTCSGNNSGEINIDITKSDTYPCSATSTACVGGGGRDVPVGDGKTPMSERSPFNGSKPNNKIGFLFTKEELAEAGLSPGKITYLQLSVLEVKSRGFDNFTIKLGCTDLSALEKREFDFNNLVSVYQSRHYQPIDGLNQINFDNGYQWDGNTNLYVQFCYSNSYISDIDEVYGHDGIGGSCIFIENAKEDVLGCDIQDTTQANIITSLKLRERPNMVFGNCGGFKWSNGAKTQNLKNLAAGRYKVTYNNPAGCYWENEFEITEPKPFTAQITRCPSEAGYVAITVLGGNPPYSFKFDPNKDFGVNSLFKITTLSFGDYIFTARDSSGCMVDLPYSYKDTVRETDKISICPEKSAKYNFANADSVNSIFEWEANDALSATNIHNPIITPKSSGFLKLTYYKKDIPCEKTVRTVEVVILSKDSIPCKDVNIDERLSSGFEVYPNPSHSHVYLNSSKVVGSAQILIHDISGKEIYKSNVTLGSGPVKIQTDRWSHGVYNIQVIQQGSIWNGKIFIE